MSFQARCLLPSKHAAILVYTNFLTLTLTKILIKGRDRRKKKPFCYYTVIFEFGRFSNVLQRRFMGEINF